MRLRFVYQHLPLVYQHKRLRFQGILRQRIKTKTVMNTEIGGVQVVIGGEGIWEELRDCSMVLARYGVPGLATGMLGILGPTRMAYDRVIPIVDITAKLLGSALKSP